ncbi:MAG: HsdM family class I SAM-dependent methyltransferase [Euzebya sp.]
MTTSPTQAYLDSLRQVDKPVEEVLDHLSRQLRTHTPDPSSGLPSLPHHVASPWLLGQARELLHEPGRRATLGAWFTPAGVARQLLGEVTRATPVPASILDPACGGGAFLLAAHERFPRARLCGWDIDPLAVQVTRAALDLAGCTNHDVRVADGLTQDLPGHDLVVGNPPFLSQLLAKSARSQQRREELARCYGSLASGYVDEAALFVLATARDLLSEGGQAVLVVPEAMLATTDGQALRAEVADLCLVEVVWRDHDSVFPGTPACALRLTHRPGAGGNGGQAGGGGGSWAPLLAGGVPQVILPQTSPPGHPPLSDIATGTADFREAYYLLADHVCEEGSAVGRQVHRIVPVGLIDPAHLRWGSTSLRFAKQRWARPVAVDLPTSFLQRRLGPKVLVATQTLVLEALVDADGDLLPSTPVITVRTDRLWHVGAALTSPVLTAIAARRHAGAARARGVLKLSAKQVLGLPLPLGPSAEWDQAAQAYRQAHQASDPVVRRQLLIHCGVSMMAAYGVEGAELLEWWSGRLPSR